MGLFAGFTLLSRVALLVCSLASFVSIVGHFGVLTWFLFIAESMAAVVLLWAIYRATKGEHGWLPRVARFRAISAVVWTVVAVVTAVHLYECDPIGFPGALSNVCAILIGVVGLSWNAVSYLVFRAALHDYGARVVCSAPVASGTEFS